MNKKPFKCTKFQKGFDPRRNITGRNKGTYKKYYYSVRMIADILELDEKTLRSRIRRGHFDPRDFLDTARYIVHTLALSECQKDKKENI